MVINGIRKVLFSGIIVGTYYYLIFPFFHWKFFGFNPEQSLGTKLILAGLILTQIVMGRNGEKLQETFSGKPIEKYFYGFTILPNFFHFTVFFGGSAILWGIVRLRDNKRTFWEPKTSHIDVNDFRTKYSVTSVLPYPLA